MASGYYTREHCTALEATMITPAKQPYDQRIVSTNFRRLMAKFCLTFEQVCESSGLDERTIRGISLGKNRPHARTLAKLAAGLGVEVDVLFEPITEMPHLRFDRATNRIVEEVHTKDPAAFRDWLASDYAQLYSQVGVGGPLTEAGVLAMVREINARRELRRQAEVIYESGLGEILADIVRMMYGKVVVRPPVNRD